MNDLVYSPFRSLGGLHRELNRVFDDRYMPGVESNTFAKHDWVPQVDIKEQEDAFLVHVDVPGVDAKDIEITHDKGVLTIKGSRLNESSEESDEYRRRERFSGSFIRQFTLPDTADAEKISAKAEHGVLNVTIPKTAAHKPLSIEVQSAGE